MKKNIFMFALCAIFAFGMTSCNPEEKTQLEERTDFLTGAKKGWELTAAESSPAYLFKDGSSATNLFTGGFIEDYEKDDLVIYNTSGSVEVDPGTKLPGEGEDGFSIKKSMGTWKFVDVDATILDTHIPFLLSAYGNTEALGCRITDISANSLSFKYTFTQDARETEQGNEPAKTYTFTLTYKKK